MRCLVKTKLFKNKFFRRSVIVLLTMALIPGMFLVSFQVFESSTIQSLSQMHNDFVEQVDTISGALLDIINNTAMQMFYSSAVKTLRTGTAITNAERTAGLRDLGSMVSSSEFLSSAMIYNSRLDYIFTSEGNYASVASELFHDTSAAQLLESRDYDSRAPVKRTTAGGECYSFLFYEPNVSQSGALLLNVRAEWYEQQLLGISSGANCVVLNGEGEVLAAGNETLAEEAKAIWPTLLERFEEDNGRGFIVQSNGESSWMYSRLDNLGWYYLRSFSSETILPGMTRMRNSASAMLLVVCALLAGGTLYALFMLYMPIKAISRMLYKPGSSNQEMKQQVDKLLESQLEQSLVQQIGRLLNGIEDDSISYPASLILTDAPDCKSVRVAVGEFSPINALTAKIDFGCAVIIGACSESRVQELCCSISDTVGCRCLYGYPRGNAAGLAQCHRSLLELWQLRFLYVGQQVLSEKLIDACQNSPGFQTKDAGPLFAALRAGHLDEARACWKKIFDSIRYGRFNDFRFAVGYIFKSLTALLAELDLEPLSFNRDMLDNLEDVKLLHQVLDDAFARIVSAQNDRLKKRLNQLAARINERIGTGYSDDALSAQHIADEMGMNAVYLGRLYRKSTGISINDAINRTRVEKSKAETSETSETVESISAKVGFSNTKYFYVIFKNIVGVTPNKFRNQGY